MKPQLHVEFVSRYRDGTLIQTNNAQPLSAFPNPAQATTTRLPTVTDPRQLYRIHRAVVTQQAVASPKSFRLDEEFGGDPLAYMVFAIRDELQHATETGFLRYLPAEDLFRATLKGAYLMSWQELWPLKGIRLSRRLRKSQQVLAELEGLSLIHI